ncbi:MAG: ATP-binding protein [Acidaminobacteraceae bacterium]
MIKKITIILFTIILFYSISFADDDLAIQSSDLIDITIGIFPNEPLVYLEDGVAKGFFIDLLNEIASNENWNIRYVEDSLSNSIEKLEDSEIDLLLGLAYSSERDLKYDYNEETLFVNWGQIYSRPGIEIESFLDLKDKLVGVYKNDIHYIGQFGLKHTLEQFEIPVNFIVIDDKKQLLKQIENGALDVGIVNSTFGIANEDQFNITRTPIQLNPVQMQIVKSEDTNSQILTTIDSYIKKWKENENSFYYESLSKTFRTDTKFTVPRWLRLLIYGILVLLILAIIIIIGGRKIIKNQTKELRSLNDNLELKVEERTVDLDGANQQLKVSVLALEEKQAEIEEINATLEEQIGLLKQTQNQLIESEKMASLGSMVASRAHELNTPLGICVTLISNLKLDTTIHQNNFKENKLTRKLVREYIEDVYTTTEIFDNNLNNMLDLVNRFKMLSSDRDYNNEQYINLNSYIDIQMKSLTPELKKSKHTYSISCDENLKIYIDPSVLSQVIRNLTMNSIIHGFENMESGKININIIEQSKHMIIVYSDNGEGIPTSIRDRVFDPFFTTKRNQGGTGLGLSIVHSSVTKTLGGELILDSEPGKGVKYTIKLPKNEG